MTISLRHLRDFGNFETLTMSDAMNDIVSVFAVCSMRPVDAEHVVSEGLSLYVCTP